MLQRIVFVMLTLTMVMVLSSASLMASSEEMATPNAAANKQVAETYFGQVLSQGDLAAAGTILAPTFERLDRSQDGMALGPNGTTFLAAYYKYAVPDLSYTIDAMAAEGDQVAVCWTATGQVGNYALAAHSGEPVTWTGMSFLNIEDGKIAEELTNLENMATVLGVDEVRFAPSYYN
jgi:predicted ester cyclase